MSQNDAQNLVGAYADGELSADIRAEFERALQRSPELAMQVSEWKRVREILVRAVASEKVPHGLAERIRRQLSTAETAHHRRYVALCSVLAAAAAIILCVSLWPVGGEPEKLLPDAEAASVTALHIDSKLFYRKHLNCAKTRVHDAEHIAGLPSDAAATRLQGDSRFHGRVWLPDLTNRGYVPAGACLCPLGDDCPATLVHVMFQRVDRPQDVISVFSAEHPFELVHSGVLTLCDSRARQYQVASVDGVTIAKFDEDNQSFVICADMGQEAMIEFANGLVSASPQRSASLIIAALP
jgi:hypothetical protein